MSSLVGTWNYPTSIRFGAGRVAELPDACRELGIQRPLLITDAGLVTLPIVGDAVARCRAAGLETHVFSGVRGNPTAAQVEAGAGALRNGKHDGVIAFGGGSALDVGKAVALVAHQKRPIWDFDDATGGDKLVDPSAMVPVVAVPTTSGTGSEVGRASVITDPTTHTKRILFHPKMLPGRVIADPALTVPLAPWLTAATGIDALSHNLEAYCAPGFHPLADGIAVEGIRLVEQSLLAAVRDGTDVDARARMMAASLMGATAFQKGLGAMHGMAHVVGGHLDAHHGLLNAIVMPYVLLHNRVAIEDRIARLAGALGLQPSFAAFLDWVLTLRRETDIPPTLDAVGMREEHVESFAAASALDPSTPTNPLPIDAAGYASLYRRALHADLSL